MNSRLYPQMTIVTHVGTVLQYNYVEIGAGFLSTKYFVFTLSASSVVRDVKCLKSVVTR